MAKPKRNSRDRRDVRRKRQRRAGSEQTALPALATLTELPEFCDLVPSNRQVEAFETYKADVERREGDASELALGCVVRLDRGYPAVLTEDQVFRAEFAAQLTKSEFSRAAVGDWVAVRRPHAHDM
ncbi:MAG: ribosome small subunit-dependent GTPase, partial [Atopobiaceae bacterium]|nr:ribosome small subunit-dependent GTPase [Atopobiaceae bacterium]